GLAQAARVWSPTPANRERFAAELGARLGIPITAESDSRAVVRDCGMLVAAVRSPDTVLEAEWLGAGAHGHSGRAARPDQREIAPEVFARAAVAVVDTREGVFGEAGDAIAAREVVSPEQVHELADLVVGRAPGRGDAAEITLFKSVGTAVQDVGIAARIYEQARARGLGTEIGGFPVAKV